MSQEMLLAEVGLYWVISIGLVLILDLYAIKKLGGKTSAAYMVMRSQKMIVLMIVSAYTIGLLLVSRFANVVISKELFTYLGIPYFAVWLYILITTLRILRSAKHQH